MRSFIHVATPPPLSEGHQGWYHLLSVNEQGGTVLFTRSDCMAARLLLVTSLQLVWPQSQ